MVHFEMDGIKFVACAAGVNPRYRGSNFNEHRKDWIIMRKWCEDQGWIINVDYIVPGRIPEGKWYFRLKEYQVLFTLRWQ